MQDIAHNESVKPIGEELKALRISKGLTQVEAAAICGVGLRTFIDWENGRNQKPLAAFDNLRNVEEK